MDVGRDRCGGLIKQCIKSRKWINAQGKTKGLKRKKYMCERGVNMMEHLV